MHGAINYLSPVPVPASHLCLTVNSNEMFSWPQVGWDNKSPLVPDQENGSDCMGCTGMFSITEDFNTAQM